MVAEISVELMRECMRVCGSAEGSVEMMYGGVCFRVVVQREVLN